MAIYSSADFANRLQKNLTFILISEIFHISLIGSRFALMELKAIIYYLLLNFSLEPNEETQIPVKIKKLPFVAIDGGVHLTLKPRAAK